MSLAFPFEYRKPGDFTYHVLTDPADIRAYLMKWIMREWEPDHNQALEEHWTVEPLLVNRQASSRWMATRDTPS